MVEFAIFHTGHQHHQRIVALIGDHVWGCHADQLWIRKDALRVVLPHLDNAAQVVPPAHVRPKQPAPQHPGDGRQEPPRITLLIKHFDLERARRDTHHPF